MIGDSMMGAEGSCPAPHIPREPPTPPVRESDGYRLYTKPIDRHTTSALVATDNESVEVTDDEPANEIFIFTVRNTTTAHFSAYISHQVPQDWDGELDIHDCCYQKCVSLPQEAICPGHFEAGLREDDCPDDVAEFLKDAWGVANVVYPHDRDGGVHQQYQPGTEDNHTLKMEEEDTADAADDSGRDEDDGPIVVPFWKKRHVDQGPYQSIPFPNKRDHEQIMCCVGCNAIGLTADENLPPQAQEKEILCPDCADERGDEDGE